MWSVQWSVGLLVRKRNALIKKLNEVGILIDTLIRRYLAKVNSTPPVRWRAPQLDFQATFRMWLGSESAISTHSEYNSQ